MLYQYNIYTICYIEPCFRIVWKNIGVSVDTAFDSDKCLSNRSYNNNNNYYISLYTLYI